MLSLTSFDTKAHVMKVGNLKSYKSHLRVGKVSWKCDPFFSSCSGVGVLKIPIADTLFIPNVIFWPSTRPKNAIPRWYNGRKWHIPMASNRKRSRGQIKAHDMGQGEGPIVPLQWCTGRE